MIPNVEDHPVISTLEGFESQEFSMAFSGHAAKVLYDQLYTNKPQSILRELATNAWDSHVEAGIPQRPFVIQLPTMLDSTLRVRDFGVSMTHQQTMKLYTTIFASSKQASNDVVGQFGLGSKSPFAYTDSFVVTCWLNGLKRTYVASLDANGMPILTHLLNEESDEETGMEVSFPVQARHFSDFRNAAQKVALGFDVLPLGVTAQPPIYSRDNWRIFESNDPYCRFSIRQGCVCYSVNSYDVGVSELTFGGYHLIIDVPIGVQQGGVDITASREALSLDDTTKANVKAAWIAAQSSMQGFTKDVFANCHNFLEATKAHVLLTKVFRGAQLDTSPWKHIGSIDGNIRFNKSTDPRLLTRREERRNAFSVHNLEDIRILIDRGQSMPRRALRVAAFFRQGQHCFKMLDPTPKEIERTMRRLGLQGHQFVSIVNLPDVIRAPSTAGPSTRSGIYMIDSSPQKKNDLPVTGGWYWIPIPTGTASAQIDVFGEQKEIRHVGPYLKQAMQILGMPSGHIYGLLPQAVKRYTKSGELTEANRLDLLLPGEMDKMKEDYYESHFWYHVKRSSQPGGGSTYGKIRGIEHLITPEQIQLIDKYYHGSFNYIINNYCLKDRQEELHDSVDKKIKELYDEFPMLFALVEDDQILKYIKQRTMKCPLIPTISPTRP